jgi:hypothetical protein
MAFVSKLRRVDGGVSESRAGAALLIPREGIGRTFQILCNVGMLGFNYHHESFAS